MLIVDGKRHPLRVKYETAHCQRVAVAGSNIVPPRHEANVEVEYQSDEVRRPGTTWATESRELQDGVMVARTLWDETPGKKFARVLNSTDLPFRLVPGSYFSTAEQVELAEEEVLQPLSPVGSKTGLRVCQIDLQHEATPLRSHLEDRAAAHLQQVPHKQL